MADIPETRYAKTGDIHIAYQVIGSGPLDVVWVPGFVSHVEAQWQNLALAHMMRRLASFSRLIIFDKPGTGMSDRLAAIPTLEQRMDYVRAVTDAVGSGARGVFRRLRGWADEHLVRGDVSAPDLGAHSLRHLCATDVGSRSSLWTNR